MTMHYIDEMLTPTQAARRCAVSYSTVKRWILTGKIRAALLPSGQWRIPLTEIAPYLIARRQGGGQSDV